MRDPLPAEGQSEPALDPARRPLPARTRAATTPTSPAQRPRRAPSTPSAPRARAPTGTSQTPDQAQPRSSSTPIRLAPMPVDPTRPENIRNPPASGTSSRAACMTGAVARDHVRSPGPGVRQTLAMQRKHASRRASSRCRQERHATPSRGSEPLPAPVIVGVPYTDGKIVPWATRTTPLPPGSGEAWVWESATTRRLAGTKRRRGPLASVASVACVRARAFWLTRPCSLAPVPIRRTPRSA
jgi:hypothetical protein